MTPRTIGVILDAAASRMRREHNSRAWHAWHTAYLTAYAPQKPRDFQKLKTLLMDASDDRPKRRQSWTEQLEIAKAWTAAQKRK